MTGSRSSDLFDFDPCPSSVPAPPTQRPESVCERWRTSLMEHYGGKPDPRQYLPQCEPDGQFRYKPHKQSAKINSRISFTDKHLVYRLLVRSSVTERPLTAGVWTRTAGRFLVPGHMTPSNLPVSTSPWWKHHAGLCCSTKPFLCLSQAFPLWPRPQCDHCPAPT